MNRVRSMWAGSTRGKVIVIIGALLGICIVCSVITSLFPRQTPTQTASQPGAQPSLASAQSTEAPKATDAPKVVPPTNTPAPPPATNTPAPSNTPAPTRTPVPTNTVVPGTSRANPVPKGEPGVSRSGWGVVVGDFIPNANQAIANANMFNKKPDAGKKYVVVAVGGMYVGTAETGRLSPTNFRLVGKNGTIYSNSFLVLPNKLDPVEVFKNGQATGLIPYEVAENDGEFVVIFGVAFGESVYMAIE